MSRSESRRESSDRLAVERSSVARSSPSSLDDDDPDRVPASAAGARSAAVDDPGTGDRAAPGENSADRRADQDRAHRGTCGLQRRHHFPHRRVGSGQGQGVGRRWNRGRPGVRRVVHPDSRDDRAVAERVAAEHRGDGEQRTRRDRGPVGRGADARLEEVARAGDERPVHGVRGAAALPAKQGADGDEAVRFGVGGRDDGPHAVKVGCAAVPGSGGGCHVRRLSRGSRERCRNPCCLYDTAADHHTRRAHADPCRR